MLTFRADYSLGVIHVRPFGDSLNRFWLTDPLLGTCKRE